MTEHAAYCAYPKGGRCSCYLNALTNPLADRTVYGTTQAEQAAIDRTAPPLDEAQLKGIVVEMRYTMPNGTVYALGVKREDCKTDVQFLSMVRRLGQTLEDELRAKVGLEES